MVVCFLVPGWGVHVVLVVEVEDQVGVVVGAGGLGGAGRQGGAAGSWGRGQGQHGGAQFGVGGHHDTGAYAPPGVPGVVIVATELVAAATWEVGGGNRPGGHLHLPSVGQHYVPPHEELPDGSQEHGHIVQHRLMGRHFFLLISNSFNNSQ